MNLDLDRAYVSPVDRFLHTFYAEHEKTESQIKEINKHKRIASMRDTANLRTDERVIWQKF